MEYIFGYGPSQESRAKTLKENAAMFHPLRNRRTSTPLTGLVGALVLTISAGLIASCNQANVFKLDCPATAVIGTPARINVRLNATNAYFSYTEEALDGAEFATSRQTADAEGTIGYIFVEGDAPGMARIVVTQLAGDGTQSDNPLECVIDIVEPTVVDCSGADAQVGIGNDCQTDADCNECQVCLMVGSVPSSTCAPQIPCETSLDCQAFSASSQVYDVNFCLDDGFCR